MAAAARGLLLLAVTLGWTASARAQELTEERRQVAAEHFERGSGAYERGDYEEAQAAFQAAYDITGHPDLLYNIYTAAERGGELDVAADALDRYLEDGDPSESRREALEIRVERLRNRIAEQRARQAQQAAQQERQRNEAEVQRQQADAARQQADAARARQRLAIADGHATSDALVLAGVTTAVAAGAALVSFGVFAALSETEDNRLAGACGRDSGRFCAPDALDDLRSYNLVADISWIAGAGLGLTAGLLVLIGEVSRPEEPLEEGDVAVRPVLSPRDAGLVLQGAF